MRSSFNAEDNRVANKAIGLGRADGRNPALLGIVIALAFTGVNALSFLAQTLLD